MVRALSAGLLLVTWATTAHAEEPPVSSCGAQAPAADVAAEEQAFSAELESFARRRSFTERLIAKREAEAFEQAALRQARAAELKRQLTEREVAKAEREFEEAVALYLKKRELTRALSAAASRAKQAPADVANPPSVPPSP